MLPPQVIQRQIPLGTSVVFTLTDGQGEVQGTLVEIGFEHLTVKNGSGMETLDIAQIARYRLAKDIVDGHKEIPETRLSDEQRDLPAPPGQDPEIYKTLIEIEAKFRSNMAVAKPEIKAVEFAFPIAEVSRNPKAPLLWNRAKSKYEYAKKTNELSAVFGRVQTIIDDLDEPGPIFGVKSLW